MYCRLTPCFMGQGAMIASSVARVFFKIVVRFFCVPIEVISDGYPSFTSFFVRSYGIWWG